jgi:hypothetical protein
MTQNQTIQLLDRFEALDRKRKKMGDWDMMTVEQQEKFDFIWNEMMNITDMLEETA